MTDDTPPHRIQRELLERGKALFENVNGCTCEECTEMVTAFCEEWLAQR
jgi:hypothetical protein